MPRSASCLLYFHCVPTYLQGEIGKMEGLRWVQVRHPQAHSERQQGEACLPTMLSLTPWLNGHQQHAKARHRSCNSLLNLNTLEEPCAHKRQQKGTQQPPSYLEMSSPSSKVSTSTSLLTSGASAGCSRAEGREARRFESSGLGRHT